MSNWRTPFRSYLSSKRALYDRCVLDYIETEYLFFMDVTHNLLNRDNYSFTIELGHVTCHFQSFPFNNPIFALDLHGDFNS